MILYDAKTLADGAQLVLQRRRAHARKIHGRLKDLRSTLSPKQAAYVTSQSPRRRLLGSRQSGKSHCIVVDHADVGFAAKNHSLYVAPSSKSARNAVWSKLHAVNNEYELGIELKEGSFRAVFPTGATWGFEGAHDSARVQRLRGDTITGKLTIDEGGFYPDKLLRELIGPVATAMFLTSKQRIAIASSPALQRRGMFFELGNSAQWEQHRFTADDNPAIKDVQQALKDLRDASAWTEATPAYQREGLGLEVDDVLHNVYALTDINLIDAFPDGPWTTIMIVDFGDGDQSAISIAGWREHDPSLYVHHVEGESNIDIEDVAQKINPLLERWNPIGIYGDTGGGGAQHCTYLRKRHGISIQPVAKKPGYKKAAIEAANADMRRGHYKVLRSSPLVEQMQALQWDATAMQKGVWQEHPSMPNDLCDVAGVYAHMHAQHFRAEPKPPPAPLVGTAEHWKLYEEEGLRRAQADALQHQADLETTEEERAYLIGADVD